MWVIMSRRLMAVSLATLFLSLTFVAAPALLTNASSVLALGTINRMLRTRERMHELFEESKADGQTEKERKHLTEVTDRVERQAPCF